MMVSPLLVAVVDDDESIRESLPDLLREFGFAAQTFASRIDQWTGTTFAGESTGSRPNHFGNERTFTLPSSGVRGTIASGWNQPVTARDDRDTIKPEMPVATNAADYFAGRDPVLEKALNSCGPR